MRKARWAVDCGYFNHGRHMSFLQQILQKHPGPHPTSAKVSDGSTNDNYFIEEAKARSCLRSSERSIWQWKWCEW
jgi:hypothetical protein